MGGDNDLNHHQAMAELTFYVERELPCICLALASVPWAGCPECGGCGTSWQEVELGVTFSRIPACRGYRNSMGVPEEPDEPACAEVESVTGPDGKPFELTLAEEQRLDELCDEEADRLAQDAAIDRAEARYEAMREAAWFNH